MLMAVHGSAVYHAAALQHIFRNGSERAAGGRVLPDGVIPVPGGEGSGQMSRRTALLQNWAQSWVQRPQWTHFSRSTSGKSKPVLSRTIVMASGGQPAAQAVQPVQRLRSASFGAKPEEKAALPAHRTGLPTLPANNSENPSGRQSKPLRQLPSQRGPAAPPYPLTDDPVGKTQPAQDAHRPGPFRGGQLRRGDRGEKGAVELDGEHRAMEGIGDNISGILEQAQNSAGPASMICFALGWTFWRMPQSCTTGSPVS